MPTITKMPNAPQFVEGIINLRGRIIPFISLRKRFGLNDSVALEQARIIIINGDKAYGAGTQIGFVVDAVLEVIRVQSSDIQPPPPTAGTNTIGQAGINGVINRGDRLLILMNVDGVFLGEKQQRWPALPAAGLPPFGDPGELLSEPI